MMAHESKLHFEDLAHEQQRALTVNYKNGDQDEETHDLTEVGSVGYEFQ